MELSTEQISTLTAWSTFAQAIFTLLAVGGAVFIGLRQTKYMKEQNNISKDQNVISEEQRKIAQEQTKIANIQAEIAEKQANISKDNFEFEREKFLTEVVYLPVLDDLNQIKELLYRLCFKNSIPTNQDWNDRKNLINKHLGNIIMRSRLDKENENVYRECINIIENAINIVQQYQDKGTFYCGDQYFQEYSKKYEPIYEQFSDNADKVFAILFH